MLAKADVPKSTAYEPICFPNSMTTYLWVTKAPEAGSHSLKQWFVQGNSDITVHASIYPLKIQTENNVYK